MDRKDFESLASVHLGAKACRGALDGAEVGGTDTMRSYCARSQSSAELAPPTRLVERQPLAPAKQAK